MSGGSTAPGWECTHCNSTVCLRKKGSWITAVRHYTTSLIYVLLSRGVLSEFHSWLVAYNHVVGH
jgi:hypothetical protein